MGTDSWGFDVSGVNVNVRPQDNFFEYANGSLLERIVIPDEQVAWGSFYTRAIENRGQLRDILEGLRKREDVIPGSEAWKLRSLYTAGMDMDRRNREGTEPLNIRLCTVREIDSLKALTIAIARLQLRDGHALWQLDVDQDPHASEKIALAFVQGGLGLPDRAYYFAEDKQQLREQYLDHMKKMLVLAGNSDVDATATHIMTIEMELARVSWERAKLRDTAAQCNYFTFQGLVDLCPTIDWGAYFAACSIDEEQPVIIGQPGFFAKVQELLTRFPLEAWKCYLEWKYICLAAPFLSEEFVNADFDFFERVLMGQAKPKAPWESCVIAVDELMSEALGKLYVEQYFPPSTKAKVCAMVDAIVAACKTRISALPWMSEVTKEKAIAKLGAVIWKLGYPDRWRDYANLSIEDAESYFANVLRANEFEWRRRLAKVGKAVDREEWRMSPQTVNAYANPAMLEMVFPAGILQSPFFDPDADDAVNFGAIGFVIGHELLHHVDDKGGKFDIRGNLNDWWTKEDREAFDERSKVLVGQFQRYELHGTPINGKLTLGENIADLGGLEVAFEAYRASQVGKDEMMLDDFTSSQRFFLAGARVWAVKTREAREKQLLVIDPHAPPRFRVRGSFSNSTSFAEAFGVKEGDGMYRPPEERARIW